MNKLIITLAAGFSFLLTGCDDDGPNISQMQPPTNISVERLSVNEVELKWQDNATAETGYAVVVRRADEPSNTARQIATVEANVTSYVMKDVLEEGYKYYLGVKAFNNSESSRVISVLYDMEDYSLIPKATFVALNSGKNCIWSTYKLANTDRYTGVSWGLCWSADHVPTVDDACMSGPEAGNGESVFQVIPNTMLDYGTEYNVRAYIRTSKGVYYSEAKTAKMTEEYPAITLDWTKCETTDIPSEIEVYKTESKLNGRPFNAWYAIADVRNGNVEFRTNVPSGAQTIDAQSASFNGDCYVLVNGGYFYDGRNTGLAVINGKENGSINAVRGSLLTASPEYSVMYNVTRGIFGVDNGDVPSVYWAGTDESKKNRYYTTPIPSVVGEGKYGVVNEKFPVASASWTPKFALSAGPLLLIDGTIPFDFTMTENGEGYYLTNYEVIAYDIFGKTVKPDRTAAGYTADGKVILFICDGRIAKSDGATLLELAQIMKGLGCVGAVNFDGGGSTGMMVGSDHVNDITPNNRPVVSTMGFFKK